MTSQCRGLVQGPSVPTASSNDRQNPAAAAPTAPGARGCESTPNHASSARDRCRSGVRMLKPPLIPSMVNWRVRGNRNRLGYAPGRPIGARVPSPPVRPRPRSRPTPYRQSTLPRRRILNSPPPTRAIEVVETAGAEQARPKRKEPAVDHAFGAGAGGRGRQGAPIRPRQEQRAAGNRRRLCDAATPTAAAHDAVQRE